MRGDIILYESTGSFHDKVIAWATGGRFTHCEIDQGDGTTIGAREDGIKVHPFFADRGSAFLKPATDPADLDFALTWAEKQVGKEYGWLDIFSNALKILGIRFDMGEPGTWDCSDFCARYLDKARAADPLGDEMDDPGLISPNDLARAYNIK